MFKNKTNITYYLKIRELFGYEKHMFYENKIVILNRPDLD